MSETSRRHSSSFPAWALALIALVGGVLLAQFLPSDLLGLRSHEAAESSDTAAESTEQGQLWTCGMHPQVIQDEPGQCPICGMDLTPMKGSSEHEHGSSDSTADTSDPQEWVCPDHSSMVEDSPGTCPIDGLELVPVQKEPVPSEDDGPVVSISSAVEQNMNVRIESAELRDLTRSIRAVGYLEFDPRRMVSVTTKFSGWIEKVHVNYVGEKVRQGRPLFEIYSPELVQTQQELLSALRFAQDLRDAPDETRGRAESLVESARIRLGYWDVSDEQIARLESTGKVFRTLEVTAPSNGLVMQRMDGLEGMAVRPGMELFHIADLSSLWLSVELFEEQLAHVQVGAEAEITMAYFPGETFRGQVRFLEPGLSEKTRTLKAKIEVGNRDGRLRKGMYATVDLQPMRLEQVLAIPSQAVLRTGKRQVVVVALGQGRFAPRAVSLGQEADGYSQVLEGLEPGEQVVVSSQFLLDSESKLREAIQKMVGERVSTSPTDHSNH